MVAFQHLQHPATGAGAVAVAAAAVVNFLTEWQFRASENGVVIFRLFTNNSNVVQRDREQEQSEHGKAEHGLCIAGDHRDGTGSQDEPGGGGGFVAHQRCGSTAQVCLIFVASKSTGQ